MADDDCDEVLELAAAAGFTGRQGLGKHSPCQLHQHTCVSEYDMTARNSILTHSWLLTYYLFKQRAAAGHQIICS